MVFKAMDGGRIFGGMSAACTVERKVKADLGSITLYYAESLN